MDHLGILAHSDINQASEALFRLFGDLQAELTQRERVVFQVEHAGAERSLVPVRMRVHRVDITAYADPRRFENLFESRNRGGFGLGEHGGRGCEQRGNGGSKKKFFHCWTFRWVSGP